MLAISPRTGETARFASKQVFLAAGTIQSSKIVLNSLRLFNRPLRVMDSQYFLFPFLLWRSQAPRCPEEERLYTLAQVFLELERPDISRRPVHFSVYSFNDQMLALLRRTFAWLGPLGPSAARSLARRMLVFGGYLHSDDSGSLEMALTPATAHGKSSLTLSHQKSAQAHKIARRAVYALARLAPIVGGFPILPMLMIKDPGTGNHYGGTFPMRREPKEITESDSLGRPAGLQRTFLVDSSCLPSIPASTITLNTMANAHRIASLASTIVT